MTSAQFLPREVPTLAKPNYQFEKRQKEIAKKKKKEEKMLRKQQEKDADQPTDSAQDKSD